MIGYIEEGRNPDIYTREFVELTQKGNRYLKSKGAAYAQLRDALAEKMVEEWPDMKDAVQRVLDGKGAGLDGLAGLQGGGNASRTEGKGKGKAADEANEVSEDVVEQKDDMVNK